VGKVRFKLGNHCQDIKQQAPRGIIRIIDITAYLQRDSALLQVLRNARGIVDTTSQPIQLRHNKRVPRTARHNHLPKAGALDVATRAAMIKIDTLRVHTISGQLLTLNL
jgi:hypothetical protein